MMEWISSPLVLAIIAGVASNLLSQIVKDAISGIYGYAKVRLMRLSHKGLKLRLSQLMEEYEQVSALRNDPPRLVDLSIRAMMPLVFTTWLLVSVIFYVHVASKSEIPEPFLYALMGIVGVGTRFFVEGAVICNRISKVCNFEEFKKSNLLERRKVEAILSRTAPEEHEVR